MDDFPAPPSPSSILLRRGQTQLDCKMCPLAPRSEFLGDSSTPTPSPTLLQRRQGRRAGRPNRLSLDCGLIRGEEDWAAPALGTQDELARIHSDYDIMEILGQGSTGVVRRACRRSDGHEVSLKIIRTSDPELAEVARTELMMLKSVQHPNIIRGYDCCSSPTCVVLVLEFFDGPTLKDAVRRATGRRLCEDMARDLFRALMSAVAYLHSLGIVHRDVKADNVMVAGDLSDLRLVDFNTAQRVAEGGALSMTGTREWAAPEALRGSSPGEPHDVWGTGLCLWLMLSGRLPQQAHRSRGLEDYAAGMLQAIRLALGGEKFQHVSDECKETLRSCLEENPDFRQTAAAVLTGPWLKC